MYSGMRATLSITFTEPLSIVRETDTSATSSSSALQPTQDVDGGRQIQQQNYTWVKDGWQECSESCGDGETIALPLRLYAINSKPQGNIMPT